MSPLQQPSWPKWARERPHSTPEPTRAGKQQLDGSYVRLCVPDLSCSSTCPCPVDRHRPQQLLTPLRPGPTPPTYSFLLSLPAAPARPHRLIPLVLPSSPRRAPGAALCSAQLRDLAKRGPATGHPAGVSAAAAWQRGQLVPLPQGAPAQPLLQASRSPPPLPCKAGPRRVNYDYCRRSCGSPRGSRGHARARVPAAPAAGLEPRSEPRYWPGDAAVPLARPLCPTDTGTLLAGPHGPPPPEPRWAGSCPAWGRGHGPSVQLPGTTRA